MSEDRKLAPRGMGTLVPHPEPEKGPGLIDRLCEALDCKRWEIAVLVFAATYLIIKVLEAKIRGWL